MSAIVEVRHERLLLELPEQGSRKLFEWIMKRFGETEISRPAPRHVKEGQQGDPNMSTSPTTTPAFFQPMSPRLYSDRILVISNLQWLSMAYSP
jgi:hypothetical protein